MDLKSLSLHTKGCMTLHLLHFMNVQKPLQWNQSNILTSFLRSMTTPFHWLPAAVRVACASHASVRAHVLFTVYIPQMESLLSALLFGKKNPHSSIWENSPDKEQRPDSEVRRKLSLGRFSNIRPGPSKRNAIKNEWGVDYSNVSQTRGITFFGQCCDGEFPLNELKNLTFLPLIIWYQTDVPPKSIWKSV